MRILIIRPGAIGDALLAFPVILALRAQHQASHVTLVSNAAVLELAQDFGVAESVFDYGSMLWSEIFLLGGIRSARLRELLSMVDLAVCWLRDAEGIVERNLYEAGVKRVLVAPGRPPDDAHMHIIEYLAESAGFPYYEQWKEVNDPYALVWHNPQRNLYIDPIAIHPGSGGARKCWPVEHFAEVVIELWKRNIAVLLLGGPADHERIEDMLKLLPEPPAYMKPASQPYMLPPIPEHVPMLEVLTDAPLREVARRLHLCRSYLGNDSGITHLAAMIGVPTVALFGPSDSLVWKPYGPLVKTLYEHDLAKMPVEDVMRALRKLE